MEEWNDGRVEEFDNSMIRQLEEWKDGRMEEWNETYQVCKNVKWGVKNSFFTKCILLFINNLQILRKSGMFVPFFASQK